MATTALVPNVKPVLAKGKEPRPKHSKPVRQAPLPAKATEPEIYYPESDGEPMAETGIHVHAILSFYGWLYAIFFKTPDIWVAANMFLYYKKGDPKRRKAPDVMVVKGVENRFRRVFKIWEEKAVPAVIFEFTSKGTIDEDTVVKSSLYASLGIKEYFLFDPEADYLDQQFIGYRLHEGEYAKIEADQDGVIHSQELDLRLKPVGKLLRVFNPLTGDLMPEFEDINDYATAAVQRAEQESQRAEQESQRAEQESQRAEQESQRAEQEAQRANHAEEELQKALAQLEELKRQSQKPQ